VAEEYGIPFDRNISLDKLLAADRSANREADDAEDEVISLVAGLDPHSNGFSITHQDIAEISDRLGVKVVYEHVCLPPVHFLWQDLVFRDYFLPREPDERYANFLAVTEKLNGASVLLFDDFTEFKLLDCAFPVLDRQFRRTAVAGLWATRFQKYSQGHHELPVGNLVLGKSVSAAQRRTAFTAIREHLQVPIFRTAFDGSCGEQTGDWEHVDYESKDASERRQRLITGLTMFLRANIDEIPRRRLASARTTFINNDLGHFCSFVVNLELIEQTVQRFESFIIQGFPNSVPLLARRISEAGKDFVFVPTLQPDGSLGIAERDFANACVIQTGAWRECMTDLPVIRIMHGDGNDSKNLPDDFDLPMRSCSTVLEANWLRYVTDPAALNNLRESLDSAAARVPATSDIETAQAFVPA
jgi:hypothetical protein